MLCYCGALIKRKKGKFCSRHCYNVYRKLKSIKQQKIYSQKDIINMSPEKIARFFDEIVKNYKCLSKKEKEVGFYYDD